ncbi:hypothetical protein G4B84_001830 [Aspergillus flavus NRRL3357]|nr:uncharacterized protein G4B84_001830 [Aspergillus flavus NRRL3357]QMW26585.1 hypothetical protein G4B84_001830 [Aspergillus flavus NRRL3357]QMW38664.1 hypothetical protein G4B11_001900 [Aspergillus flavus]
MIDDAVSATGVPIFAATLFCFVDQGVGLCVCYHHNAVHATGFTEVTWAAVLYSLTSCSIRVLATSNEEAMRSLFKICARISESQSHSKINSRHIAELYRLVNSELISTCIQMDFGPMLGRPKFFSFPCMEADEVAIILPRQRCSSEEKLEIMVMLRRDDLESLENDSMWRNLISEDDN